MVYAASSWRDGVQEVMDAGELVLENWQCPDTGCVRSPVYRPLIVDGSYATLTGG